MVIMLFLYFAFVRPIITLLRDDQTRTSALATMLPLEIFQTVPSFRRWAGSGLDLSEKGSDLAVIKAIEEAKMP